MSCILRASGSTFDLDAFMCSSKMLPDTFWRKGQRRYPKSQTNKQINENSGIRFITSEADFSELSVQIDETILFLKNNLSEIKRLASFPGVEGIVLDFGTEIYDPYWASFTFPPALLLLAGDAKIAVCLSVYPSNNEESNA